ncbi:MAG: hypothetical protein N3J91_03790 [Verrucomicrobiae bacterium]|nr:hypothetical protein [Verrucomicrobiae bacterium]
MADFHLRLAHDTAAAQAALRRIIELYPDSALARQAEEAIVRLPTHAVPAAPATIRLGQYERYPRLNRAKTR